MAAAGRGGASRARWTGDQSWDSRANSGDNSRSAVSTIARIGRRGWSAGIRSSGRRSLKIASGCSSSPRMRTSLCFLRVACGPERFRVFQHPASRRRPASLRSDHDPRSARGAVSRFAHLGTRRACGGWNVHVTFTAPPARAAGVLSASSGIRRAPAMAASPRWRPRSRGANATSLPLRKPRSGRRPRGPFG